MSSSRKVWYGDDPPFAILYQGEPLMRVQRENSSAPNFPKFSSVSSITARTASGKASASDAAFPRKGPIPKNWSDRSASGKTGPYGPATGCSSTSHVPNLPNTVP